MHKLLSCAICLIIIALFSTRAFGSDVYVIPDQTDSAIGLGIQYLKDEDGSLTFDKVRRLPDGWRVHDEVVFNQGYSKATWWLKFDILNPRETTEWVLEIAYAVLDYVDVYVIGPDGQTIHYQMGDKHQFNMRPIEHRYFAIPLKIATDEQVSVYLKIKSSSSIQVPLTLWEREVFNASDIGRTAVQGLYYGGLVIIAIYNLLIYLALGERTYLYYVGYVMAMFLFMASLNGWAFQFLWPNATHWNDTSIMVSLTFVVLFGAAFARRFLDLSKISPFLTRSSHVYVGLSLILIVACFYLPYSIAIRIVIIFAVSACFYALIAGIYAWLKGNQSASIYVVAWSGLLIGGIILALNKIHVLPRNLFTDYATQLGSLLEVVLLSFALAERINRERALRFSAQQEALKVQQLANEELEKRVSERTQALEEANKKLQELSDTDQLTGLKNRRYLNQYLDKEFMRGARYRHDIAVLLIDIDHFKLVNDTHGHQVGDDCLQAVSQRIGEQMRWPTDLAARYGGEEFCVVLPETNLEGALTVAERIRSKVCEHPVETRETVLNSSVSVGVYAATPDDAGKVNDFIAAADEALYKAKQNGRNRVEVGTD